VSIPQESKNGGEDVESDVAQKISWVWWEEFRTNALFLEGILETNFRNK